MSALDMVAPVAGPLLAALVGSVGGVRFVQESQRGIKLRFGRVLRTREGRPRIIQPGFVLVIPTIHSLRRIHVRTQTLALTPQKVMLADHTVFNVGALVITRIIDTDDALYRALFEVDDVALSVEEFCAAVLRDVLLGTRYEELEDPERLATQVRSKVEPRLIEWGVQVVDFKLTDCSPAPETAKMILIGTETRFRLTALQQAALQATAGGALDGLHPTVAAALIGTPVAVSLGQPGSGIESVSTRSEGRTKPLFALHLGSSHASENDVLAE